MTHWVLLLHETLSNKTKYVARIWFASSFHCVLSHVEYLPVRFSSWTSMWWASAPVYAMWCVFRKGLTFSPFKATLPGFRGWRCRGQTEVICHSDQPSQLWDGAIKLTGSRYPGPCLVFGFPPSCFFFAHMALYDICPSAFSQINTMRWARNRLGDRDGVHASVSGKDLGKSAHKSRMLTNTKEIYGEFHYSSEDGFFKAPAGCVIRNAPKKSKFQIGKPSKNPYFQFTTAAQFNSSEQTLYITLFLPTLSVFHVFKLTHQCNSILQRLAGHLLGCFHAQTHILCSDLLTIVLRAHWSKERLVRIFLNLDSSCPIYKGQPMDYTHILGLPQT